VAQHSGARLREGVRIVVVDDHPVSRKGLIGLLESEEGFVVCGETDDPAETRRLIDREHPDLVLVDLSLGRGSGLDLVRQIRQLAPSVSVLVVSMHEERLYAERALRAGASGYISKSESPDRVIEAVRTVLAGQIYLSDEGARRLLERAYQGGGVDSDDPAQTLSDRELEIFVLIGEGLSTRLVAERLERSIKTIETHRDNIRHKLGDIDSATLVQRAVAWHLKNRGV